MYYSITVDFVKKNLGSMVALGLNIKVCLTFIE